MLEFSLRDFSPHQFMIIAQEAANALGWDTGSSSEEALVFYTPSLLISWREEIKIHFDNGFVIIASECTANAMFDWGRNKRNVDDFMSAVNKLVAPFPSELLRERSDEPKPEVTSAEAARVAGEPRSDAKQKITGFLSLLKPQPGYFVTPILIYLNVAIFILMVSTGSGFFLNSPQSLIHWGANFRPLTLSGEWWRLVTSFFVHIGLVHLLANMLALFFIGILLERHLGTIRFIAAYILAGVAASMTSLCWYGFVASVGASGAILGLYGVFLAMLTTDLVENVARRILLTCVGIFVACNLLLGWTVKEHFHLQVDNAAHIGGLIFGLLIGYAYYPSLKRAAYAKVKYWTVSILLLFVVFTTVIVYHAIPRDNLREYLKQMKEFALLEQMALEIYRMPANTPKEDRLSEIKERGLYFWNQDLQLLNHVDSFHLPPSLHQRDRYLIRYCKLRIRSYKLLYKAIEDPADIYQDSLKLYNAEILSIMGKVKKK